MNQYGPEGARLHTAENRSALQSHESLMHAFHEGRILEAPAVSCDSAHNLIVDLRGMRGVIPREEAALGVREGTTRDIAIISRVGRPVSFVVTGFSVSPDGRPEITLSRRIAQQRCLTEHLQRRAPGDVLPAVVTHLEPFGCFADIGCGIVSLIPIDLISVSRISHPCDRFRVGDPIFVAVAGFDERGRVCLTHKELLGTWAQNAQLFESGETVTGIVRSVEPYGVFVELTPNLAGLAEPFGQLQPGQTVSVFIKSILPGRMKIKLIIVSVLPSSGDIPPLRYFIQSGHLDRFTYSPENAARLIETVFDGNVMR